MLFSSVGPDDPNNRNLAQRHITILINRNRYRLSRAVPNSSCAVTLKRDEVESITPYRVERSGQYLAPSMAKPLLV